jgi:hypothetical protein
MNVKKCTTVFTTYEGLVTIGQELTVQGVEALHLDAVEADRGTNGDELHIAAFFRGRELKGSVLSLKFVPATWLADAAPYFTAFDPPPPSAGGWYRQRLRSTRTV